MILHNQKNAPLQWEACGQLYVWEPYGTCDVPERFVDTLRAEGFPVAATPIPPQQRARIAVEAETAAERSSELGKLRTELAETKETLKSTAQALEESEAREVDRASALSAAVNRISTLEEQLQSATADCGEFERLLTEAGAEIEKLKTELAKARESKKQGKKS